MNNSSCLWTGVPHFTCWRFWSYCVPFHGSKFPLRQHLWTAPCSRQLALQGIWNTEALHEWDPNLPNMDKRLTTDNHTIQILPRVEQSVPHPYKAHVYPWPTTWQDASESVFRCCACLEAWLISVESICNVYQCLAWFSLSFAAWLRMSMVTTLMTKLSLQVAHDLWMGVLVQNVQIILP